MGRLDDYVTQKVTRTVEPSTNSVGMPDCAPATQPGIAIKDHL